ncbi:MAG: hypothetical protein AAGD00_04820 [Planctomycetota bacterium]
MKLVAYLLMALATMAGSIAAATTYLVPLGDGSDDSALIDRGIELAAPAGAYDPNTPEGKALAEEIEAARALAEAAKDDEPEPLIVVEDVEVDLPPLPAVETAPTGTATVAERTAVSPIAVKGDTLNAEMIALLRAHDVRFIKSASFDPAVWFRTWPSWVFLLSVATLFVSAMMVRAASKGAGQTSPRAAGQDVADAPETPVAIADAIRETVGATVRDVRTKGSERERLDLIIDNLGEVQRTLVPAFASARPQIIQSMGMGGYAQVMDAFADCERQINRAWSAAADGVEFEAVESLERADAMLPALIERLRTV